MEYYATVQGNFNDDMYPVTNYFGVLQAVKLNSIKTVFSFYFQRVVSSNQFSELYLSIYDEDFSNSRTSVWKKLALDSDLTDLSNSLTNLSNSLGNAAYSTLLEQEDFPNNFANKIPIVRPDGVMEVGQYIDFHIVDSSKYDYDVRLQATKNGLWVDIPQLGGGVLGYWTISKGTNGWARESSTGFTIQWGTTGKAVAGTTTFPRKFTTLYGVYLTQTGLNTNDEKYTSRIKSFSTTSFNWLWGQVYVTGGYLLWYAIGIS